MGKRLGVPNFGGAGEGRRSAQARGEATQVAYPQYDDALSPEARRTANIEFLEQRGWLGLVREVGEQLREDLGEERAQKVDLLNLILIEPASEGWRRQIQALPLHQRFLALLGEEIAPTPDNLILEAWVPQEEVLYFRLRCLAKQFVRKRWRSICFMQGTMWHRTMRL